VSRQTPTAVPYLSKMATPKVLILMADYGHEPTGTQRILFYSREPDAVGHFRLLPNQGPEIRDTALHTDTARPPETAVPYTYFKNAGFHVQFATEEGKSPECDKRLCEGVIQKLLVYVPLDSPTQCTDPIEE